MQVLNIKLVIYSLLIFLQFLSFSSCNSAGVSGSDKISQKIDSLIEIQKINDQCILVKFGADAITAINTAKGIVVIDAGISSGLTSRYRTIIEKEFSKNDFACLINTHGHPDHYGGNSIFTGSVIIGHVNCLQEITEQWENPEKTINSLSETVEEYELQLLKSEPYTREGNEIFTQKIRYQYAYDDAKNHIPVRQPDIVFSDSMNINMGDNNLEMFYFGKCHSISDIIIYVPEMKILFTGDLFFNYGRPSINDSLMKDKERWQQAVHWIEKRMINIDRVVSGHGQIMSIDDLRSFNINILSR